MADTADERTAAVTPAVTVDAVGLLCPVPIFKASKAIKSLAAGAVLELLADDEQILEDLPNWCKSTGHALLSLAETDGEYRGLVRKKP